MKRLIFALALGIPTPVLAQVVQAPIVLDSAGKAVQATPVITVDPAGGYAAGGGGGTGGGGDASAANQTTQIGHEANIAGGVGGVNDAAATVGSTGSASSKLRLMTTQLNAISGFTDGVEGAIAALPQNNVLGAGTNTIGKLGANAGVIIGDVNVTASALATGAATSAKQPALGTAGTPSLDVITVQGNASGTPLPMTATALPLPTGAATAVKQPALGVAGTPSADVITVQGAASGTAIPVAAATLPLPTGSATSANQVSLEGKIDTLNSKIDTLNGKITANGNSIQQVEPVKPNGSSFDYEPPTVDTTTTEAVTTSNNNECMDVNASAKYRAIANPTTGSMMRVQFGTSVAAADYWEYIAPGQTWVATTPYGVWLGKISCQWLAATGDAAVITQLTGP